MKKVAVVLFMDSARHFQKSLQHRSEQDLESYLIEQKVPVIEDIDTRSLVRHLRDRGAMKGVISTDGTSMEELQNQLDVYPSMVNRDLATDVNTRCFVAHEPENPRCVNVIDGGCKENIIRLLTEAWRFVRVVPIHVLLKKQKDCDLHFKQWTRRSCFARTNTKITQLSGKIPMAEFVWDINHVFGFGSKTKLPFGHRGSNHPTLSLNVYCRDSVKIMVLYRRRPSKKPEQRLRTSI